MLALITFLLSAYATFLTALAYLFCFGDPGTLGGWFPFLFIVSAMPLTAILTYWATHKAHQVQ